MNVNVSERKGYVATASEQWPLSFCQMALQVSLNTPALLGEGGPRMAEPPPRVMWGQARRGVGGKKEPDLLK